MLTINHRIRIPLDELSFSYSRSSGPGGQNVNKVNSKATLKWNVANSLSIPEDVRRRFLAKYPTKLSNNGEIVINSAESRDQARNRERCLEKLRELLLTVAVRPKIRRKTKPSKSKIESRLKTKKLHSSKKKSRVFKGED